MEKPSFKRACLGVAAIVSCLGLVCITVVLVFMLGISMFFVQLLDEVTRSWDEQPTGVGFFESGGGWDYRRIALIEPYEARSIDKETWLIGSKVDSTRYQSSILVTELDVVEGRYIITYAPDALLGGEQFADVWFVIIPEENVEEGFSTEESFLAYLEDRGIERPDLIDVNQLYQEFVDKGYLEWFPEEYKE